MRPHALIAMVGTLIVSACNTTASAPGQARIVLNGQTLKVDSYGYLEPDCSSIGKTTVQVIRAPEHGSVEVKFAMDFPRFAKENIRAHCNTKRAPATQIFYTPSRGYTGPDSFQIEAIFPDGRTRTSTYRLDMR
jgi:hypothetical protein